MIKKRFTKRVKRSLIWKIPIEKIQEIVSKSNTISEILSYFDLKNKGGNYRTLKNRLTEENIDFSHIKMGIDSNRGRKFLECCMSKEECLKTIFTEHSTWGRGSVKRYIRKHNLVPYQCKCGIIDVWQNESIKLQLDHKNGTDDDNRIENLRWLCPNCHSQTETFCGKNNL